MIRGRFRESFSAPKPFVANQPTRVRINLEDILHTFPIGHRVMIQIQSTWFPFIDRNHKSMLRISLKRRTRTSSRLRIEFIAAVNSRVASSSVCYLIPFPSMSARSETKACDLGSIQLAYHREFLAIDQGPKHVFEGLAWIACAGDVIGERTRFYFRRLSRQCCKIEFFDSVENLAALFAA